MNVFRDYTLKWYDAGILKWTTFAFGLFVGAKWPGVFEGWTTLILVLGMAGVIYLMFKYWPEMFGSKSTAQEDHTA